MKKLAALFLTTLSSSCVIAQTWTVHNANTVNLIIGMSFPTADTGYVLTDQMQMRKTTDGAATWSTVTLPASTLGFSLFFTSGNIGYVSNDSAIYKTINGGASWSPTVVNPSRWLGSMFFPTAQTGYASGSNHNWDTAFLFQTINAGATWTQVSAQPIQLYSDQSLFFVNPTTGFWNFNSGIFSTVNSGANFTNVYTELTYADAVEAMSFPNIDTGYAIGWYDIAERTTDGGTTWQGFTYPGDITYDLHFFDGKKGFSCGGNGFSSGWVQQTSDEGVSWTPVYTSSYTFYCMNFPNDTAGYVGGDNGTVLKYSRTPSGITEKSMLNNIGIYPNPSNGAFTIAVNANFDKMKIEITDLQGRLVMKSTEDHVSVGFKKQIDLQSESAGMFFVKISADGKERVEKISVEK